MKNSTVNNLKAAGKATDTRNPQARQVVVTAGKIRIQVNKGADRGQTNR